MKQPIICAAFIKLVSVSSQFRWFATSSTIEMNDELNKQQNYNM